MLKKLRNRFLIINMASIFVLVIIALLIIFFVTKNNIDITISQNLDRAISMATSGKEGSRNPSSLARPEGAGSPQKDSRSIPDETLNESNSSEEMSPSVLAYPETMKRFDDFRSFAVELDSSGDIVSVTSFFGVDNEFYTLVSEEAPKLTKSEGRIKIDDLYWAYKTKPLASTGGSLVAFTDITSEENILVNLITTFSFATVAILIVLFFISLHFANRSLKPVKEAWEKQKQFVADASHELKTPLAVINTNIDVVLSHPEDKVKDEEKWLMYIKNECGRMASLTNDLLYLAKAERSEEKTVFNELSLSYVVESSILAMEAVTFEKNIALDYYIEPGIDICGNEPKLKQLIMILIDNAIKYTPQRGSISIRLELKEGAVFKIRNTGSGISKEDRERIFDRFYRVDKARSREEGSYGLGLAIAKAIVEEHKGKISVESKEGEWTLFTVFLPNIFKKKA